MVLDTARPAQVAELPEDCRISFAPARIPAHLQARTVRNTPVPDGYEWPGHPFNTTGLIATPDGSKIGRVFWLEDRDDVHGGRLVFSFPAGYFDDRPELAHRTQFPCVWRVAHAQTLIFLVRAEQEPADVAALLGKIEAREYSTDGEKFVGFELVAEDKNLKLFVTEVVTLMARGHK